MKNFCNLAPFSSYFQLFYQKLSFEQDELLQQLHRRNEEKWRKTDRVSFIIISFFVTRIFYHAKMLFPCFLTADDMSRSQRTKLYYLLLFLHFWKYTIFQQNMKSVKLLRLFLIKLCYCLSRTEKVTFGSFLHENRKSSVRNFG